MISIYLLKNVFVLLVIYLDSKPYCVFICHEQHTFLYVLCFEHMMSVFVLDMHKGYFMINIDFWIFGGFAWPMYSGQVLLTTRVR